jgi:hypothetical protein
MTNLDPRELAAVTRELDDSPHLVKWLQQSRELNRDQLEAADDAGEFKYLQGQNSSLKQILDKLPKDV